MNWVNHQHSILPKAQRDELRNFIVDFIKRNPQCEINTAETANQINIQLVSAELNKDQHV